MSDGFDVKIGINPISWSNDDLPSLGALAENVKTIPQLEAAMARARAAERTYLICIETDPDRTTAEGGCWWEVAVPEVSDRVEVRKARHAYENDKQQQKP